jgi:curved DNA-binding protein CbpA
MSDLDQCYKLLGLEPGASPEEVNQAYKDLAFIWHPDRIPEDNLRLRQKAEEKLKEINHARDQLRSARSSVPNKTPQSPRSHYSRPPQDTGGNSRSHSGSGGTSGDRKKPPQSHSSAQPKSHYQTKSAHSDLSGADFRGADLKEKDLSGRNLSHANLSQANLSDGFLHKVNLQGANLYKANLFRANLLEANLRDANLRETNLIGADLSGADLRGADLRGAKIGTKDRLLVKLVGANFAGAILPDGTIHE